MIIDTSASCASEIELSRRMNDNRQPGALFSFLPVGEREREREKERERERNRER